MMTLSPNKNNGLSSLNFLIGIFGYDLIENLDRDGFTVRTWRITICYKLKGDDLVQSLLVDPFLKMKVFLCLTVLVVVAQVFNLIFIEEFNSDRFLMLFLFINYLDGYGICHPYAKGLPRHPPSLRSAS